MARIRNSKPKDSGDGYFRILGNKKLGELITKVQSTVTSAGTELERIIHEILKHKGQLVENVDIFLDKIPQNNSIFVLSKKALKKSKIIKFEKSEPDFVLLKISSKKCHIIELKEGYLFDTKKAAGEKLSLQNFENTIAKKIPFATSIHLCCFNCEDKTLIMQGLKQKFTEDEILTGREFCKLFEIEYDDIINKRNQDQKDNFDYFIEELLTIDSIKSLIIEKLK